MLYKNIYYQSSKNLIHLWTDKGYLKFPYERYGYKKTSSESKFKTIYGENVTKVNIGNVSRDRLRNYLESDVKPELRILVDYFYKTDEVPSDHVILNFDIEVEKSKEHGYSDPTDAFNPILSISTQLFHNGETCVFLLDEKSRYKNVNNYDNVYVFNNEIQLLKEFIKYYKKVNPTILTGWNIKDYDIPYVYYRVKRIFLDDKVKFFSPINIVYELDGGYYDKSGKMSQNAIGIAGVSILDGILLYKNYCPKNRASYSLDNICEIELDIKKVEYDGSLQNLYETDIDKFVEYNLRDVELVKMLEDKLKYMQSHLKLCHYAHVPYELGLFSTILHEGNILKIAKKKNLVWYNKPTSEKTGKIVGAYVKGSKKGRFDMTYDQDLTSLYPMTIVTCNISPETKYAKIRDYISVWEEKKSQTAKKGETKFKINYDIFDHRMLEPDFDKVINVHIDLFRTKQSFFLKTMGDLYAFLEEHNCTLSANGILYKKDQMGILPEIILDVFKDRKRYKNLRDKYKEEGDKEKTAYYDQEQWKYKIVMNSLYGVLLQKSFRLFDIDNGQSITMTGRYCNMSGMDETWRIHKRMKEKAVKKWGEIHNKKLSELFDDPIITGDTDSIILTSVPMLYTNYGRDWKSLDMEKKVEETIKMSVYLANKINKRMDIFAKKWLNSDNNYLSFKQEWVAKSGFYVGVKKRYANHIIWQEGVNVDYIDIKGLDIVRSSFPKVFQKFMKDILIKILDDEPKDEIFDFILEFKGDITKQAEEQGYDIIAFVSSINNYDQYVDEKNKPKKGTPWHIKGAANYNELLDSKNLKEYIRLSDGDKIGVLYLKNNVFGIEQISYPLDNDIPEFIKGFISSSVDYEFSTSKLIDNKLQKYYDAMDWEAPVDKESDITTFF